MGSSDFLDPSAGNLEVFERLVNEIRESRCCAFIGAGLSADAFYPSWNRLVQNLKKRAEEIVGKDIIFPNDINAENIELLRQIIPEKEYWQIIFDIFGPREKHPYVAFHCELCSIPWVTFITTNYDYCLENASVNTPRKLTAQFTPELDLSRIDKGHVFHIHGIIDALNPGVSKLSAVLSKSDYDRAYTPNSNLPRFLASLSEFYTLVFWGYGFRDQQLNKVIHETQLEIEARINIELKNGLGQRKPIEHYIIHHPESEVDFDAIKYLNLVPIILNKKIDRRDALYRLLTALKARTTSIDFNNSPIHMGLLEG